MVYIADNVGSPFVMGIINPRIYLSSSSGTAFNRYALRHERVHIKRHDNLWKLIGFIIVAIHWFNPLVWLSYKLFNIDVEITCDEKVVSKMEREQKKAYAKAILNGGFSGRKVSVFNSAFSGSSVRAHINAVIGYKKPKVWTIILSLALCLVLAACFFTNQKNTTPKASTKYVDASSVFWEDNVLDIDYGIRAGTQSAIYADALYSDRNCALIKIYGYGDTGYSYFAVDLITFDDMKVKTIDLMEHYGDDLNGLSDIKGIYKDNDVFYAIINEYDDVIGSFADVNYRMDFDSGRIDSRKEYIDAFSEYTEVDIQGKVKCLGIDYCLGLEGSYIDRNYILMFNEEGTVHKVPLDLLPDAEDVSFLNLTACDDGVSFFASYFLNGEKKVSYCCYDHGTDKLSVKESSGELNDYLLFSKYCDGKFYYCDSFGCVGFDPLEDSAKDLLLFKDTYINNEYGLNGNYKVLYATEEELVLLAEGREDLGSRYVIKLQRSPTNPNKGKILLSLGYIEPVDTSIYRAVNRFNRKSHEYYLEIDHRYNMWNTIGDISAEDPESFSLKCLESQGSAIDKLISDIRSGAGPDLVLYNSSYASLNNDDLMADLHPIIKERLKDTADLMSCIYRTDRDDKVFRINYSYEPKGILVRSDMLDQDVMTGFTFDEYKELIAKKSNGRQALSGTRQQIFDDLYQRMSDLFVNDKGEFDLDNQAFYELAAFVKDLPEEPKEPGKAFCENGPFSSMLYEYGEYLNDYMIVGTPSFDGRSEVLVTNGIGISASSANSEGAFEFIMTMLEPDIQSSCNGLPVNKGSLRTKLIHEVEKYNRQSRKTVGAEDIADHYLLQTEDAVIVPDTDPVILKIFYEEMPSYFDGKDLDSVIKIIENRVNTYLSEQNR